MRRLTNDAVEYLFHKTGHGLVSIYMPTHRYSSPPNMQEDQTRFKNLVRQAAEMMDDEGIEATRVEEFKKDMLQRMDNREFWQNLTEAMAIFADESDVVTYRLPIEVEEQVSVGSDFEVTPLLVIQEMNRQFYVLALAMHGPKLYKGDIANLYRTSVDLPESPEEALNIDEMFINSNTIRGHEGSGGLSHAIGPHGQGDSAEAGREERLQYFRIIENNIRQSDDFDLTAPFIVAATDSEAGDFMANTTIPKMVDNYIPGNHTKSDLVELHQKALALIQSNVLARDVAALVERYQEQKGVDKSSSILLEIEEAAAAGRIDTLLVDIIDMTTDSVRDIEEAILKLRYHHDKSLDRFSSLIRSVVDHGGRIVGLRSKSMPDGAKLAALYRY